MILRRIINAWLFMIDLIRLRSFARARWVAEYRQEERRNR